MESVNGNEYESKQHICSQIHLRCIDSLPVPCPAGWHYFRVRHDKRFLLAPAAVAHSAYWRSTSDKHGHHCLAAVDFPCHQESILCPVPRNDRRLYRHDSRPISCIRTPDIHMVLLFRTVSRHLFIYREIRNIRDAAAKSRPDSCGAAHRNRMLRGR